MWRTHSFVPARQPGSWVGGAPKTPHKGGGATPRGGASTPACRIDTRVDARRSTKSAPRVGTLHAGVRAPHPEPKLRRYPLEAVRLKGEDWTWRLEAKVTRNARGWCRS